MTEFKMGDRVQAKAGAQSKYGVKVGGLSGIVATYLGPYSAVGDDEIVVSFKDVSGDKLVKIGDLVKIETPDDEKIEEALRITKEAGGYCEQFDEIVEYAKNLPLMERLECVARATGKTHVFEEFKANLVELTGPKWEVGDVVPRHTKLSKVWLSENVSADKDIQLMGPGEASAWDRKILWIEE